MDRRKLDVGDYGVIFEDGYEVPLYYERKSKGDLFGTLGRGYERFRKEIKRAKDNKHKLVLLIEGNYASIKKGHPRSMISGEQILHTLHTLQHKYDLDWHIIDRKFMAEFIYDSYCSIGRMKGKKK